MWRIGIEVRRQAEHRTRKRYSGSSEGEHSGLSASQPPARSKVPEVTLDFWLVKIAATTLGETGGDAGDDDARPWVPGRHAHI